MSVKLIAFSLNLMPTTQKLQRRNKLRLPNIKPLPGYGTAQLSPTLTRSNSTGFTLLESLIALCLVAILALIAIPSWRDYQENQHANTVRQSLQQSLDLTQSFALLQHQNFSLCPSADQKHCQAYWRGALLAFLDPKSTGQPSNPHDIYAVLPLQIWDGRVSWRNFRHRAYLTFDGHGNLLDDDGTLLYCPNNTDTRFTRALAVNTEGRVREIHERNAAGLLIDSHGQVLNCNDGFL